jgi:hypothetical protein
MGICLYQAVKDVSAAAAFLHFSTPLNGWTKLRLSRIFISGSYAYGDSTMIALTDGGADSGSAAHCTLGFRPIPKTSRPPGDHRAGTKLFTSRRIVAQVFFVHGGIRSDKRIHVINRLISNLLRCNTRYQKRP